MLGTIFIKKIDGRIVSPVEYEPLIKFGMQIKIHLAFCRLSFVVCNITDKTKLPKTANITTANMAA